MYFLQIIIACPDQKCNLKLGFLRLELMQNVKIQGLALPGFFLFSLFLHPPLHFIHAFIGVAVYLADGFAGVFLTVSCTICRVHF